MARYIVSSCIAGAAIGTICTTYYYMDTNRELDSGILGKFGVSESPCKENIPMTTGHPVRVFPGYVLQYDQARRTPNWVAEHLTRDGLKGDASRRDCRFTPDPRIPPMFQAQNEDYRGSGWSRGHMAAAGNHKRSLAHMTDTFLLSNIVPQDMDNNSGFWNRLEMLCRNLTKAYRNVYVLSGPLYLPRRDDTTGRRFVTYEVIGTGNVAVPTHLFKVILCEDEINKITMASFIVPNESIDSDRDLRSFQVPLEAVESTLGVQLLRHLDAGGTSDLCAEGRCALPAVPAVRQAARSGDSGTLDNS